MIHIVRVCHNYQDSCVRSKAEAAHKAEEITCQKWAECLFYCTDKPVKECKLASK
jgi:hypothetical protein